VSKRDQLGLFDGGAPRDEVEPAQAPRPRTGRAPRRLLVQALTDDAGARALTEELERVVAGYGKRARLVALDPARDIVWSDLAFLALDTETTGLDPAADRVIELGWSRVDRGEETDAHAQLCSFDGTLDESVSRLTGLSDAALQGAPSFADAAPALLDALAGVDFVAAYNAAFDRAFLANELQRIGRELPDVPWIDPLVFIREVDRYKPGKKLSEASQRWGVSLDAPHRALADARATAKLLLKVAPFLPARTLTDLIDQQQRWGARQATEPRRPAVDDDAADDPDAP
jgi:DNA polymerase III epsilon subunit-like protein